MNVNYLLLFAATIFLTAMLTAEPTTKQAMISRMQLIERAGITTAVITLSPITSILPKRIAIKPRKKAVFIAGQRIVAIRSLRLNLPTVLPSNTLR